MKVKELKNILNNLDDNLELGVRNGNGAIETNNISIKNTPISNVYLIDANY